MRWECRERFPRSLRVNDPDMHHGTCVTHVPWCMPGSLTRGFLWSQWRGQRSRHSRRMRNTQLRGPWKRLHYWPFMQGIQGLPVDFTSDAGLCGFICCQLEQAVQQTLQLPVVWDATAFMRRHCMSRSCEWSVLLGPGVLSRLLFLQQLTVSFKVISSVF